MKQKLLKIPAPNVSVVSSLVVRTSNGQFETLRKERAYAEKKPSRLTRAQFNARLANQLAASIKTDRSDEEKRLARLLF